MATVAVEAVCIVQTSSKGGVSIHSSGYITDRAIAHFRRGDDLLRSVQDYAPVENRAVYYSQCRYRPNTHRVEHTAFTAGYALWLLGVLPIVDAAIYCLFVRVRQLE